MSDQLGLFGLDATTPACDTREPLAEGALVLRGFARDHAEALLGEVAKIVQDAPFRHMVTPGGFRMSVGMSNTGDLGWVTDSRGYRYASEDPQTGRPWPPMPKTFRTLAEAAAKEAGYPEFSPDACLVNRYEPGARMTLHQDRNERNFRAPIVSVSLGLSVKFLFGGLERRDKAKRVRLDHGDVVVWGGPSRLAFHGVLPLADGEHPLVGKCRVNLTFREAGRA
jgi:alkylated DNA repair protein (DNA oxidative demethylase)